MEDPFVPVRLRRQGKMISVVQFLSVALMCFPFIGVVVVEGWPLASSYWPWATLVGAGLMLVLIETRLAELLNEAQEVNALLRNIVKQPSSPDLEVQDILRLRRVIFPNDRHEG